MRPELTPLPERMKNLPLDARGYKQQHPLFDTWRGMIRRCHDPAYRYYRNYGARGIMVCQRWRESFWAFVDDVSPKPSGAFSLDRRENDGHYEPDNVRWATRQDQARNTRFNRKITLAGRTQTLEDWTRELGIAKSTLFNRLRLGWTEERTLTTKPHRKLPNYTYFPPCGTAVCKAMGIARETVESRIRRGWSFEDAISKPVDHRRNRHGAAA
jgi:hypothetical protein